MQDTEIPSLEPHTLTHGVAGSWLSAVSLAVPLKAQAQYDGIDIGLCLGHFILELRGLLFRAPAVFHLGEGHGSAKGLFLPLAAAALPLASAALPLAAAALQLATAALPLAAP